MHILRKLVDIKYNVIGATVVLDNGYFRDFLMDELILFVKQNKVSIDNAVLDKVNKTIRSKNEKIPLSFYNRYPKAPIQMDISKVKKLLSSNMLTLYHGSKNGNLIPKFGYGSTANDYGRGFYTTPDIELGKEWSCSPYEDFYEKGKSYIYTYTINHKILNVLDLTRYDSMCWLAELLTYRHLNLSNDDILIKERIRKLVLKYKLDTSKYDIIIGYRADDKYFKYAYDFVSGRIYREVLEKALRNGNLGLQVFIKSERAFNLLNFKDKELVNVDKYTKLYNQRNKQAIEQYNLDVRNNKYIRIKDTIDTVISDIVL